MPVSTLRNNFSCGTMPTGTAAYEKRGLAVNVPEWNGDKCVQCNMCSLVCPHAVVRPFLVTPEEASSAPDASFVVKPAKGKEFEGLNFRV